MESVCEKGLEIKRSGTSHAEMSTWAAGDRVYSLRQILPLLSLIATAGCQAVWNHGAVWWKCTGIRPDM